MQEPDLNKSIASDEPMQQSSPLAPPPVPVPSAAAETPIVLPLPPLPDKPVAETNIAPEPPVNSSMVPPAAPAAPVIPASTPIVPNPTPTSPEEDAALRSRIRRTTGSMTAKKGTAAAQDERLPLPPGTQVGDFTIKEKIGIGGFGIVYSAVNTKDGSDVAIKEHIPEGLAIREPGGHYVIHSAPESEERFKASVSEFLQEVSVLMGISHPGIVPILSAFEANGTAYYVMPFMKGDPLTVPAESSLSYDLQSQEARHNRRLLLSLLSILDYLRMHNIVHRDIKPDNILITAEGSPVLLDFGSARQLQEGKVFTNVYTPDFAAPEQVQGVDDAEMSANLGPWTDIYALGVCFYYMLTHLYPPKAELRMLSGEGSDPYTPLAGRADLEVLYGAAFLKAIDRALELKREDRWQTAAAWKIAIGEGTVVSQDEEKKRRFRLTSLIPLGVLAILGCISFWALWERRAAIRAYDNSAQFTERLLYDFNQEIADIPASTRLQGILGDHLNNYLNNMGRPPGGRDEKLTLSLAASWRNLGVLRLQQGLLTEADSDLRNAEGFFRQLCEEHPTKTNYCYDLAGILLNRIEVARSRNQSKVQAELLSEALQILEKICKQVPYNPEFRCCLGEAFCEQAFLAHSEGNTELYKNALEKMLDLYRNLLSTFSDHIKARQGLGYALVYNAQYAMGQKDFNTADKLLDEARKVFTDLSTQHPYRLSFKKGLSLTLYNLGRLYNRAGESSSPEERTRYDERALEAYRKHNEIVRYLETQDEKKTEYPYMYCQALSNMVDILLRNDQPNLAEAYSRTIMRKIEKLRKTAPDNVDYAMLEAAAWRGMALAHSRSPYFAQNATEEFTSYRRLAEKLLEQSPANTTLQFIYTDALMESANHAVRQGDTVQASKWYAHARDLLEKLTRIDPSQTDYKERLDRVESLLQKTKNDEKH